MKILLIATSSEGALTSTVPDKYKNLNIGYYPPLGLMYIASYLKKYSKHKAEIFDVCVENASINNILKKLKKDKFKAVGFYTTSFNVNAVYDLVKIIKSELKDIKIILGGPHIDLFPEETAMLDGVDYVVMGEGEITLKKLLDCIENGENISTVKGVAYKFKNKATINEKRALIENLDILSFPARHLTKYKKYHSVLGKNRVSTTLMTSRGCPFRCNFCFKQYDGRYRMRSAINVIQEIEECIKLGINEFFFFDEIFTANKQRVLDICNEIKKRNLKIIFDLRSRVDTIDEEMLFKLKEAGCSRIQFGVESGTNEILLAMNKGITVDKARESVLLAKKAGLDILIDFMIGYPGETLKQIEKTIKFACELDPDYVQFGITILFPGTKIYADALTNGFLREEFWRNTAKNPPTKIVPPFASDKFERDELKKILERAYIRFYFRPKYLIKRIFKLSSWLEFRRQFIAGMHLLLGK